MEEFNFKCPRISKRKIHFFTCQWRGWGKDIYIFSTLKIIGSTAKRASAVLCDGFSTDLILIYQNLLDNIKNVFTSFSYELTKFI